MPLTTGVAVIMIATATPASVASSGDGGMSGVLGGTGVGPEVGPLGPLTEQVIQRLLVSDQVAAAKFGSGQPIDDPAREQQVLASARRSAVTLGIDPDAVAGFFQQQINASKVVQQGLFDRWAAHPDQAPATRPDLTQIRDELDQLTTELLQQLVAQQHVLAGGVECQVDLAVAAVTGEVFNQLDALHRKALTVALAKTMRCVSHDL